MTANVAPTKRRIAYLQKAPSGHSDSCLRALVATGAVELFATIPPTLRDSPFSQDPRPWISHQHPIVDLRRDESLVPALREFDPELMLVVGWEKWAYRHAARSLRRTARRVVCMDQQYRRTWKQRAGIVGAVAYLRPYFDAAFVPGARQREFAMRLGFDSDCVYEGFYSCDVEAFSSVQPLAGDAQASRRAFLYVGRLSPEKSIDVLVAAYLQYRIEHADPWDLLIAGIGPLAPTLQQVHGARLLGFVQPRDLAAAFGRAACLVLPSSFEPWGVVVHEAAAAGLGLICTTAVGAADTFLSAGVNGQIVAPRDLDQLTTAMSWFHGLPPAQLVEASITSRMRSRVVTPERWAETVLSMADGSVMGLRRAR